MTDPAYQGDGLTAYVGDNRVVLAELPAESVHCVVTSPPYWGLRDYGTGAWIGGDTACDHRPGRQTSRATSAIQSTNAAGAAVAWGDVCRKCGASRVDAQLGLEASPAAYVADLVGIMREVRRVLRPEGTVWLNIGDSYARTGGTDRKASSSAKVGSTRNTVAQRGDRTQTAPEGLKEKDLVGIPWRVAFALQADGWFLRSDIVWSKPNPMPESVTDRPTRSHEYVFLLTKQARYYFDAEAVREPALWPDGPNAPAAISSPHGQGFTRRARNVGGRTDDLARMPGGEAEWQANGRSGRNIRSVWTIATEPYPGAHYATFPTRLVEPCVKAGSSERGCCPECGAPWTRIVERRTVSATPRGTEPSQSRAAGKPPQQSQQSQIVSSAETIGWQPSCSHGREAGDWDVILTPIGAGQGPGFHADTHGGAGTRRRGLDRRRRADEGTRPMYRWQQRAYARQLRDSPFAAEMRRQAGAAFDHYTRTDLSGARAIPAELLDRWRAEGWLGEPQEPVKPTAPLVPAVVLDPFAGSGTTGRVALELGRHAILVDLNPEYVRQAIVRASHGYADPGGQDVPADSLWHGLE